MAYIIAVDDGHGMETPGKRTPVFPDGTVILENQFNSPASKRLAKALKRCGMKTIFVAPEDADTPLRTRTNRANDANADLYISIHYNAYKGVWGDWGGISTFYYPGSVEGQKLAGIVQKYLARGTPMRNRGIHAANFFVLRETRMTAILCECGFMDNIEEARLMLDPNYQEEVAEEICQGVCEYLGVEYVPSSQSGSAPENPSSDEPPSQEKKLYRVQVGAFTKRSNAEKLVQELKEKGYSAFIRED